MKRITKLAPNQIFVFGSNLAGIHGAGAALDARKFFGAERGTGEGITGQCYALPTCDQQLRPRSLEEIRHSVNTFLMIAQLSCFTDKEFIVTPVGCGIAGYDPEQIAPMFKHCPDNVKLPPEFL